MTIPKTPEFKNALLFVYRESRREMRTLRGEIADLLLQLDPAAASFQGFEWANAILAGADVPADDPDRSRYAAAKDYAKKMRSAVGRRAYSLTQLIDEKLAEIKRLEQICELGKGLVCAECDGEKTRWVRPPDTETLVPCEHCGGRGFEPEGKKTEEESWS